MAKRGLQMTFEEWPARDQEAWHALFSDGDIFDGRGPALHWRAATRKTNLEHYARWLAWLDSEGILEATAQPWCRVTPERIKAYASCEMARVAPVTVASTLIGLKCVVIKMNPDMDWTWLREVTNRLKVWAKPVRARQDRLLPANEMMAAILAELDRLSVLKDTARQFDLAFRDTLIIGILICCPIRLKNIAMMHLGQHIRQVGDEWRLSFDASETKTYQDLTYVLPRSLAPALTHYLSNVRPGFPRAANTLALWMSQKGSPLAYQSIYGRVIMVTDRLFEVDINPHAFRTIAASWLAHRSSSDAAHARPILGNRDQATTERHYIQPATLEASRKVSDAIIEIRKRSSAKRGTL